MPEICTPVLSASNISGVENTANDSLSNTSSVSSVPNTSSKDNSIYSKRNCNGLYEILENIRNHTFDIIPEKYVQMPYLNAT